MGWATSSGHLSCLHLLTEACERESKHIITKIPIPLATFFCAFYNLSTDPSTVFNRPTLVFMPLLNVFSLESVVENVNSRLRLLGLSSQLCHLLAV